MKDVDIPSIHRHVRLVPREQLRRRQTARRLTVPRGADGVPTGGLPKPPDAVDWAKKGSVVFPILGNDDYGDCYYTACAHAVQSWSAIHGRKVDFDAQAVVRRYIQISGGDNGLNDATMMGEFLAGIIGPTGPHKILGELSIPSRDVQARALALYLFGPTIYTASLLDSWVSDPKPGQVWDATGSSDPNNGHAMLQTAYKPDGALTIQTWGFDPPITVTERGYQASDPTTIALFSTEWFDAQGKAPNGYTYEQLAAWWTTLGGSALPPSPFGPAPPPGPGPVPVPTGAAFAVNLAGTIEDAHGKKSPITLSGTAGLIAHKNAPKLKAGTMQWEAAIGDIVAFLRDMGILPPRD